MSNAGQAILTVVGTVVGAYFGYPQLGFVLGSLAGQALFPAQLPSVTGPQLTDRKTTTASVGDPVLWIFGDDFSPGEVIWLDELETVTNTQHQGKGGPSQDFTTFTYFQSIAIGICGTYPTESGGPGTKVLKRIWENGKLVYDIRGQQVDETDEAFNARILDSFEYSGTFVFYNGDADQLPDPTIEAVRGVGNTPGYRGLCYIVYPRRQLQDNQAQRHPAFRFEVGCDSAATIGPPLLIAAGADVGADEPFLIGSTPDADSWEIVDAAPIFAAGYFTSSIYCSTPRRQYVLLGVAQCMTSSDGRNWIPHAIAGSGGDYRGIAYSPDLDLLVITATDRVKTSADGGVTWVEGVCPTGIWAPVIWSKAHKKFVAGSRGGGTSAIMTSVDGFEWIYCVTPNQGVYALAENDSGRIVSGNASDISNMWSTDAISWEASIDNPVGGYGSMVYGAGVFLGYNNTVNRFVTSGLGISGSWQVESPPPLVGDFSAYCYSEDLSAFVAISAGPTADPDTLEPRPNVRVMTSGGHSWNPVPTPEDAEGTGWGTVVAGRVGHDAGSVPCNNTIGGIVRAICERVGLTRVSTSDIDDIVIPGYALSKQMNARAAIDPLRSVGWFDVAEIGTNLHFVKRGKPAVATLEVDDLGAYESGSTPGPAITTKKTQPEDLPLVIRVHYFAISRDYEFGEQPSPYKVGSAATNEIDVEIPVPLEDQMAAEIAEALWADAWTGANTHETTVDRKWIQLTATDPIIVPLDGQLERMRVVNISDASVLLRKLTLVRDDDDNYIPVAVSVKPERPPTVISSKAPTLLVVLDLPMLRSEDNDPGVYVAARAGSGASWGGAVVFKSCDDGTTWTAQTGQVLSSIIGDVVTPLGEGPVNIRDVGNVLTIQIPAWSGTPESITFEDIADGMNACAIGVDGRWEVCQFMTATQIGPNTWELRDFYRGRRGTERFIGTSELGDTFVLLDPDSIVRVPVLESEIGDICLYRPVTFGTTFDANADQQISHDNHGEALKPFSPVDVAAEWLDDDIIITWTRRDRAVLILELPLPMNEATEAWEIDVVSPGSPENLLRTIVVTGTDESAVYTAAQQATDGNVTPVEFRVYQISAVVGRGSPGTTTFED